MFSSWAARALNLHGANRPSLGSAFLETQRGCPVLRCVSLALSNKLFRPCSLVRGATLVVSAITPSCLVMATVSSWMQVLKRSFVGICVTLEGRVT